MNIRVQIKFCIDHFLTRGQAVRHLAKMQRNGYFFDRERRAKIMMKRYGVQFPEKLSFHTSEISPDRRRELQELSLNDD